MLLLGHAGITLGASIILGGLLSDRISGDIDSGELSGIFLKPVTTCNIS